MLSNQKPQETLEELLTRVLRAFDTPEKDRKVAVTNALQKLQKFILQAAKGNNLFLDKNDISLFFANNSMRIDKHLENGDLKKYITAENVELLKKIDYLSFNIITAHDFCIEKFDAVLNLKKETTLDDKAEQITEAKSKTTKQTQAQESSSINRARSNTANTPSKPSPQEIVRRLNSPTLSPSSRKSEGPARKPPAKGLSFNLGRRQ